MIIYKILTNGYYGGFIEVSDTLSGIPYGYTRTEIIDIPDGYYAKWGGSAWSLTKMPPPVVVEETVAENPIIDSVE